MNRLACCVLKYDVVIYAFSFMGNHFHFALRAPDEDTAIRFANEFKQRQGMYQHAKYGSNVHDSHLPIKVIPVKTSDYLKALICYIIKNPTKARIGMFYNYRWGSGGLYFSDGKRAANVSKAGDLTVRQLSGMINSRQKIPAEWLVSDGVILPDNYVAVTEVETLFKTVRSFMYHLSSGNDDELEKDYGEWNAIRLADSEMRKARNDAALRLFGTASIRDLPGPSRLKLARFLRQKYLCPVKQLSRVVLLPFDVLKAQL